MTERCKIVSVVRGPSWVEPIEPADLPRVEFTGDDKAWLASLQSSSAESLKGVVDVAASLAQQRVSFNVGGMPVADLAEVLAERFQMTLPKAAALADTSVTVFYRSIAERGFADIEKGLPVGAIRYRYFGPDDKITRKYCHAMLARTNKKPLTREQIDEYPNGELPQPFLSGGGYGCRHQWLLFGIATTEALAQAA